MKCRFIVGDGHFIIGDKVDQYGRDTLQVYIDITKKPFLESISYENIVKLINETNEWNKNLSDDLDIEETYIQVPNHIEPLKDDDIIKVQDSVKVRKYIEQNSIFKKHRLNIINLKDVSHEDFDDFYEFYKNYDAYVLIDGNRGYCSLDDYKKTVEGIDYFVNIIKKYDLSPLEQIMFAYDLVRNRVYKEAEEGRSKTDSRDITSVLSGDYIVCVGFTKIFNKVLDALNIKNSFQHLKKKETTGGHVRSKVLVEDSKYNVFGFYYFDPTWDCKKSLDDKSHVNIYTFFGLTKAQANVFDRQNYIIEDFPDKYLEEFEHFLSTRDITILSSKTLGAIKEIINEFDLPNFITDIEYTIISNKINVPIGNSEINYKQVKKDFETFKNYIKAPKILISTIMDAFLRVRKIENYIMPDKFPFDESCLKDLAENSAYYMEDKAIFEFVFGTKYESKHLNGVIKNANVPAEIQKVNLARVLKKVLESKR